jgi:hypothetical protein
VRSVLVRGFPEQFERDVSIEPTVRGEVDDAHAATAEDALDVIAGNLRHSAARAS